MPLDPGGGGCQLAHFWRMKEGVPETRASVLIQYRRCLQIFRPSRSHDTARTMSQENVEIVKRCVDALSRKDVDGYLACCTDDVEMRSALVALEGAHLGPDGIRRFFA